MSPRPQFYKDKDERYDPEKVSLSRWLEESKGKGSIRDIDEFRRSLIEPPEGKTATETTLEEWSAIKHKEWVREIFTKEVRAASMPLKDTVVPRTFYAWRLTREMALLRGMIGSDEMLSELNSDQDFDAWIHPQKMRLSPGSMKKAHYSPEAVAAIEIAESLGVNYGQFFENTDRELPGLALSPPIPPAVFWDRDEEGQLFLSPKYNVETDRLLNQWLLAIRHLSDAMMLERGDEEDRFPPQYGLRPLLRAQTAREAWPTRGQICSFENILVSEAQRLIVQRSTMQAKKEFSEKYGLLDYEIESLFRIVRENMKRLMDGETEDFRALMVLRFEDFLTRCRESFDLSNEIKGLKALATALGIHHIREQDIVKDIEQIIGKASEERRLEREKNLRMLEGTDGEGSGAQLREIVAEQRGTEL